MRTIFSVAAVLGLAACAASSHGDDVASDTAAVRTHAKSLAQITSFGANPGELNMWEYVPASAGANAPVVVVLHGCMEHAADAALNGWNQLADEKGFIVVYPEQQAFNNGTLCFDWSNAMGLGNDDAIRGHGENESVHEMAVSAVKRHNADPTRVYVAGFSAGAAEAVVVGALYPDVFAGVVSFAGVPYGCADTLLESVACMEPGVDHTPSQWGKLITGAFDGYTGPRPKISIWQGSLDNVVYPMNQSELVKQWTNIHGLSATPTVKDTVDGQAHAAWKDASGKTLVETYLVDGMWHGMPIDPANGCGTVGEFAFDFGICGPRRATELFGL